MSTADQGRKLLTTEQLCADKLQISVDRFYRIRDKLERKGFPTPLPGFGTHRYDPAAVDAWFTAQMRPELRALLTEPDGEALRAELKQRVAHLVPGAQHHEAAE